MIEMDQLSDDDRMTQGFDAGFSKAAVALAQLSNATVRADSVWFNEQPIGELRLAESCQRYNHIPRYLLTTEIFGSLSGKCYLFLSEKDFSFITRRLPDGNSGGVNIRDEFIKELDNILSASVITQLSNALNRKMYGDVPVLVGKVSSKLEDIITDDFGDQAETLKIHSGYFNFDCVDGVSPLFIWVFDSAASNQEKFREVA